MSAEDAAHRGPGALMGNLVVCLAGNRRRKQMEGGGGFTASWCIHLRGGTIPPARAMAHSDRMLAGRQPGRLTCGCWECWDALLPLRSAIWRQNVRKPQNHCAQHKLTSGKTCGRWKTAGGGWVSAVRVRIISHRRPVSALRSVSSFTIEAELLPPSARIQGGNLC